MKFNTIFIQALYENLGMLNNLKCFNSQKEVKATSKLRHIKSTFLI